jgi:CelD/BcsL family acetyltransferase involved in cellulose biosynthesis
MQTFTLERGGTALEREWEWLAQRTGAAPFLRPGWFRAWAGCFDPEGTLRIAALRRDGTLVAALPVLVHGRVARAAQNSETPGFDAVATDPDAAAGLLRGLLAAPGRRLELRYLPAGGVLDTALGTPGSRTLSWTSRHQPWVPVEGDWVAYERNRLGGRHRRDLGRQWRRLDEQGGLRFAPAGPVRGAELDALLDEAFRLEASGWKGRAGSAILSDPRRARFYRELAHWAAGEGLLRLSFLRAGGRAAAFCYALRDHEALYALKIGYDEQLGHFSPGMLALREVVRDAFADEPVRRVELLGEDAPYKHKFAQDTHEQRNATVLATRASILARARCRAVHETRVVVRERLPESARSRLADAVGRLR